MAGHRSNEIVARLPVDRPSIAVEIGVDQGATSAAILARRPLCRLTMVDRWKPADAGSAYDATRDTIAHREQNYFDKARRLAHAQTDFAGDRRTVLEGESWAISKTIPDATFDLVFDDGDHSTPGVLGDLEHWWAKLKPGGWWVGHDWERNVPADRRRYGVNEAVEQFFGRYGLMGQVEFGMDSCFAIRKPADRPDSILDYADRIRRRQVTIQANYGDGEWSCILGRQGVNSQGGVYTPDLAVALSETVTMPRPGMFYGTGPGKRMDADVNREIALRAPDDIAWVRKEILSGANVRGELGPFLAALATRRVVLVGPEHLRTLRTDVLAPVSFVGVPLPGAWDVVDQTIADVVAAVERTKAGVVLFCSGMSTNVAIWRLAPVLGDQCSLIDAGAIFDPYVGVLSRKHYKRDAFQAAMETNIREVAECAL